MALAREPRFQPNSKELSNALQKLFHTLSTIDNPDLIFDKEFAEYLFFPIRLLLEKQSLGELTTEYVLRILNFLIRNAWSTNMASEMAKQLLMLITMLVGGPPTKEKANSKLKLNETGAAGCEAINSLFVAIASLPNLQKEFSQGIELLPSLGHTITVLLDCAVLGVQTLDLQMQSIEAMITLTSGVLTDGDVIASLTPGIVSAISKMLAQRNSKRHYTILVKALDLYGITLAKVFNDADLCLQSRTDEIDKDVKSFRTQPWLTASRSQVKVAMNSVVPMRFHTKTEVHAALLRFSLDLLTSSLYSLENCVSILIDNILVIASLETTSNPALTESAFFQFGTLITRSDFVKEALKERVYDWIESLPRLLTAHDESQGLLILNCITTSMKLLSTFLGGKGDIDYFQEQILKTLQETMILKPSVKLLPGVLPQTSELTTMAMSTELVAVKAQDGNLFSDLGLDMANKSIEIKLREVLAYTGSISGTLSGFQNLMSQIQVLHSPATKTLTFWMAVNTFKGIVESAADDMENWIMTDDSDSGKLVTAQKDDAALDMYDYCSDVFANASSALNTVKGNERYDDALLCFALQGMESVAMYMGENFKSELMDVLYPLIDFLGSPNVAVRNSAQRTIVSVARSCGYPNLRALLVENSDYIIDTLSTKLNTLDFSPQGPLTLTTLIKLSGIAIIPYLDDIVESLFAILDNYHGYAMITNGIFQVLESVVVETGKGYQQLLIEDGKQDPITIEARFKHTTTFDDLLKELDVKPEVPDFYDTKGVNPDDDFVAHDGKPFKSPFSKNPGVDETNNEEDEDFMDFNEDGVNPTKSMDNAHEQEEKEWKSPVPKSSYELVKKIVGYTDRFLTHDSPNLRKLLLDLTSTSLPVLASSTKEFLPLVNAIWPILVAQLDDSELYVVEATLKLIGELCTHARDFMTTRVTAVWKKLRALLPARPKDFVKRSHPKFSVEQRTLDAVLGCLATVARATRLETVVFFEILDAVGPFLDQHRELADALGVVNIDAVWFEMAKLNKHHPVLDAVKYPSLIPFVL